MISPPKYHDYSVRSSSGRGGAAELSAAAPMKSASFSCSGLFGQFANAAGPSESKGGFSFGSVFGSPIGQHTSQMSEGASMSVNDCTSASPPMLQSAPAFGIPQQTQMMQTALPM